jgi:tRNA pseudouridine55 synthase
MSLHGVLLVDKPCGPTSFEMVRLVRRLSRTRKVGHAGTLDPLASGLLAVCVGEATKLVPYLLDHPKRYSARIALGRETTTDDSAGEPRAEAPVPHLDREAVEPVLDRFVGTIEQVPPAYSALKRDGEPLYRRARRGEEVALEPRQVTIRAIELEAIGDAELALRVECERGTYIRALSRDLGRALGTRAHLAALRRTACSGFQLTEARSPEELEELGARSRLGAVLIAPAAALRGLPRIAVDDAAVAALRHGQPIAVPEGAPDAEAAPIALIGPDDALIAVARLERGHLQPVRVFGAT